MRKKNLIIAIICFALAVIYAAAMIILYDRLAGFFGTVALMVPGIVNMVKAFKK